MRVAIVGMGYWGQKHARCFKALGCDIVTVDPEAQADFKDLTPALDSVQAVVIASPASTHFMQARQALLAGKHVLCEKPLALSVHEVEKLKPADGQVLMTGHTYLFNEKVREVKERLPEVGPLTVTSAIREGPATPRHDCDVLHDLAVHDIAIALHLMGKTPVGVSCTGTVHHAQVCLRWFYQEHTRSHITASWLAPEKTRRMYVSGTLGALTFDELRTPPSVEPLMTECREFMGACEGAPYISDWSFTLDVARILHAAAQSQIDRGEDKPLPCIPIR